MNRNRNIMWAVLLTVSVVTASGCATSNAFKGGAIGAAGGGALGAVIGNQLGDDKATILGAIIGAAVGGTAGALIGAQMDKQAAELQKDLEGAKIERVGEGIKITFESGLLFGVGSASLQNMARENLAKLAVTLNKYPDTNILIEGHTDSDGSEDYNQKLSERRSTAVSNQLKSYGVAPQRCTAMGYGETQALADNTSDYGKAQNRRVDIAIFANDKLKSAAMKKAEEEKKMKK